MFGFVRGVRGRAVAVVLVVAGLVGGVAAGSVAAANPTTVTWKVSLMWKGEVKYLSAIATTNSPGVKTWSIKDGACFLSPKFKPTTLTMKIDQTKGVCTLSLKIAKSGKHPAKTSTKLIFQKFSTTTTTTVAATTTTVAPTTTTTVAPTTTTTTTTVALTCATGGVCYVGATGPGGGVVFYDAGSTQPWGRYLEAAPVATLVETSWATGANVSAAVTGADGTAIGTGAANTLDIVAQSGNEAATSAAVYCDSLSYGGFTDWFLPSKDELNQMHLNKTAIGVSLGYYWSSSESGVLAWYQYFNNGTQSAGAKADPAKVIPVRAF